MVRGRDLPEVAVPSGRAGARTWASLLPVQSPPLCFPASRTRRAGGAQGHREPGRPVCSLAPAPCPPTAGCPEALVEPRPPCQGWLSCLLPVHSVCSSLPLLPSPQSCCTFWGTNRAVFPQGPTTSQAAPTMSCGGRRPRSSRRRTGLWGTGATRTCSEPRSAAPPSVRPSVRPDD